MEELNETILQPLVPQIGYRMMIMKQARKYLKPQKLSISSSTTIQMEDRLLQYLSVLIGNESVETNYFNTVVSKTLSPQLFANAFVKQKATGKGICASLAPYLIDNLKRQESWSSFVNIMYSVSTSS